MPPPDNLGLKRELVMQDPVMRGGTTRSGQKR